VLLYVLGAGLGALATVAVGSPWVDAKALAIASPVALVVALAGFAALAARGRRVGAGVAILIVAGGVCWSNALAYRDVWLAPRSQLHELEVVGNRFAGDGPALMTDYSPYGARHFLRKLDPESASELRHRPIYLRNGQEVTKGGYADIDAFGLADVLVYRTLVLVHSQSPAIGLPPRLERELLRRMAAAGSPSDADPRARPARRRHPARRRTRMQRRP
jgi:hypothetical protein